MEEAAGGVFCCLARSLTPVDAGVAGVVPAVAGVAAALVAAVADLAEALAGEVLVAGAPGAAGRAP